MLTQQDVACVCVCVCGGGGGGGEAGREGATGNFQLVMHPPPPLFQNAQLEFSLLK